jgi:hypothetical protein
MTCASTDLTDSLKASYTPSPEVTTVGTSAKSVDVTLATEKGWTSIRAARLPLQLRRLVTLYAFHRPI